MNVQHFEKGIVYTDKQLMLIARKIGKLATYCRRLKDEASLIRIEAERKDTKKSRDQINVIVNVSLPHKMLSAECFKADPIEALDRCVEKLEPQIQRYKDLHMGKRLGKGSHRLFAD
jgi:ribosome-associated translation inhibitor RaiA